jgi:hypothetical protein
MALVVFTASTLRFRRDLAPAGGGDDDATETPDAAPVAAAESGA